MSLSPKGTARTTQTLKDQKKLWFVMSAHHILQERKNISSTEFYWNFTSNGGGFYSKSTKFPPYLVLLALVLHVQLWAGRAGWLGLTASDANLEPVFFRIWGWQGGVTNNFVIQETMIHVQFGFQFFYILFCCNFTSAFTCQVYLRIKNRLWFLKVLWLGLNYTPWKQ